MFGQTNYQGFDHNYYLSQVRVQGGGGSEVRLQGGGAGDKIGTMAEKKPDKSDVSNNMEKPIENQSAPKRTWGETAAAAGVLTMVREGEAFGEVIN